MNAPIRPALRWHGGKWLLAPWIISHFPVHRCYVEPYGGAMSVLLRKKRSYAEVYNDLDIEAVNLFRVLRSGRAMELKEKLHLTPFAREEFRESYEPSDDPVEGARRFVTRSFMGFGSNGHNPDRKTGFRANSRRSGTTPAQDWRNYAETLPLLIERLKGVVVENRDALEVMAQHDAPETLHYVDPPYLPETRSGLMHSPKAYFHEMSKEEHIEMLDFIRTLKGMVIVSGYQSVLYDRELSDFTRVEKKTNADGASARMEILWISPAARARPAGMGDL